MDSTGKPRVYRVYSVIKFRFDRAPFPLAKFPSIELLFQSQAPFYLQVPPLHCLGALSLSFFPLYCRKLPVYIYSSKPLSCLVLLSTKSFQAIRPCIVIQHPNFFGPLVTSLLFPCFILLLSFPYSHFLAFIPCLISLSLAFILL